MLRAPPAREGPSPVGGAVSPEVEATLASCGTAIALEYRCSARKAGRMLTLKKASHPWKHIVELHLTEEKTNLPRLYIDQPGYVDIHWFDMGDLLIDGQSTGFCDGIVDSRTWDITARRTNNIHF